MRYGASAVGVLAEPAAIVAASRGGGRGSHELGALARLRIEVFFRDLRVLCGDVLPVLTASSTGFLLSVLRGFVRLNARLVGFHPARLEFRSARVQ